MSGPICWLSFCDNTKPRGSQFLGGCVVRGASIVEATVNAHALGINPGGEVLGVGPMPGDEALEKYLNRLLSLEEIEEMDRDLEGLDSVGGQRVDT